MLAPNVLTWAASRRPAFLKERKLSQVVFWPLSTCMCTPHTHTQKKNFKYFPTFITHVCLPSSLSLISEKLMLGWQNKRQEGKWITTQDVKSLVVRLVESKGWKSTSLSLHFHHFCKRSYNLTSASSISVPWFYPTPHSLWARVSSISSFNHFNILCRLQLWSFSF